MREATAFLRFGDDSFAFDQERTINYVRIVPWDVSHALILGSSYEELELRQAIKAFVSSDEA